SEPRKNRSLLNLIHVGFVEGAMICAHLRIDANGQFRVLHAVVTLLKLVPHSREQPSRPRIVGMGVIAGLGQDPGALPVTVLHEGFEIRLRRRDGKSEEGEHNSRSNGGTWQTHIGYRHEYTRNSPR